MNELVIGGLPMVRIVDPTRYCYIILANVEHRRIVEDNATTNLSQFRTFDWIKGRGGMDNGAECS
jgi:hypothetical protein